jgi:hypothetical protein
MTPYLAPRPAWGGVFNLHNLPTTKYKIRPMIDEKVGGSWAKTNSPGFLLLILDCDRAILACRVLRTGNDQPVNPAERVKDAPLTGNSVRTAGRTPVSQRIWRKNHGYCSD